MAKCKIVFLDSKTVGDDVDFTFLEGLGDVIYYDNIEDTLISEAVSDANVVITNKKILHKGNLQGAKALGLICVTATGYNNIDLEYCRLQNIAVSNVRGYSTESVVQQTFSLLLDLYNKNHYYHDFIQSEKYSSGTAFSHFNLPFHELRKKVWGVVGMGDIGRRVSDIASAFGCCVQYYSTSGKNHQQAYPSVDLDTLLSTSDIITIHAPLNSDTENLFTIEEFKKMKSSAYIINVGRGKIINEEDLVVALNQNLISGAGLDVFASEPFTKDSPLLTINNPTKLLMTPHIAWATVEARNRCIQEVAMNIESFLNGKIRNAC